MKTQGHRRPDAQFVAAIGIGPRRFLKAAGGRLDGLYEIDGLNSRQS